MSKKVEVPDTSPTGFYGDLDLGKALGVEKPEIVPARRPSTDHINDIYYRGDSAHAPTVDTLQATPPPAKP